MFVVLIYIITSVKVNEKIIRPRCYLKSNLVDKILRKCQSLANVTYETKLSKPEKNKI